MKNLRINIIYQFHEGSWGGGNQFLKALKNIFEEKGIYEKDPYKANCFLINSHHSFEYILPIKKRNQDKIFIHRIDGPLYLTRRNQIKVDYKIYQLNRFVADGTIFQSNYSKKMNLKLGMQRPKFSKIIPNASDHKIFHPKKDKKLKDFNKEKCQLIATSWSKNILKGFELYKYLDENLNFNDNKMILVGRSPIRFKNIKHIGLVKSNYLANLLRDSDIYVSGARKEACSNSLIEALSCGLPSVVIKSGSNPELIKGGGEIFKSNEECIKKIDLVKSNYEHYKNNIFEDRIEDVAKKYINFFEYINHQKNSNRYKNKNLRNYEYYKLLFSFRIFKITILKIIFREFLRIINCIKIRLSLFI